MKPILTEKPKVRIKFRFNLHISRLVSTFNGQFSGLNGKMRISIHGIGAKLKSWRIR
ncbi:MAG TPA: hypothetical protein VK974_06320 [Methylophilaceae bacterium]|nr:hypothetical protein [Methylophilaceae bacterium]